MVSYTPDLLPGRPYVAGVSAEGQLHAELWRIDSDAATVRREFDTSP